MASRMAPRRGARARHRPRRISLDLTPMVDVVFLLIIFFLLSTTFITFEDALPVTLPQAESTLAQPNDLPTVTVDAEETLFFGAEAVSLERLSDALQNSGSSLSTVVLRADERASHGFTVQVMDAIKQAGAENIAIATGGQ